MDKPDLKVPMHFRIDPLLAEQLREASEKSEDNPYPPTQTQVVEEGLKLALRKLKNKKR